MDQTLINWLMAGFGGLIGFMLHMLWQSVKDLQSADKALTAEVSQIKVLVAGNYVERIEFNEMVKALFAKLDKISDKIDKKADK